MTAGPLLEQTRRYYEAAVRTHGASPRGADWNSLESQEMRFEQLSTLIGGQRDAGVVDYGCGYGALAAFLRARGHRGAYQGFDLSDGMIEAARTVVAHLPDCQVSADRRSLRPADYTLASGIFNVKQDAPAPDWHAYLLETLDDLRALARRGFAFNALTRYSDADRQRADLYYADPLELFEYCRRRYSRHVALLHDYPLYEFTLLVRL